MDSLRMDNTWQAEDEAVKVVQVNPNAPINSRVLVDFSGKLPPGFRPMEDLPQYQPIVPPPWPHYPTNRSSGKNAETV